MATYTPSRTSFSPLNLEARSGTTRLAAVAFGTLLLAVSSQIEVPMVPVPITLQTLIVPLIGALYGWRLGMATVLAWLGEAMLGLPVLAGGAGGLPHFAGPTAGYLVSFPIIAALTGFLAERGWNGNRVGLAFVSFLAANLLCLALGALWLSSTIGIEKAVAFGVTPFLVGGLVKSALGAAILKAATRDNKA
ncbi:biotin transport system substrate-specific component [Ochrobactrum daejeonense]|uniref:Biotin transporter n=1 Tax=Brucella daejeonensis TaxID=659015 RepID=A0A7W9AYS2_9HYPH|nr:biotin transporter BioY [Brucella daejeonensis]MBB5702907.1 biotin transport system substrate-specific component [Brucella daejeonensis]NKB79293.1 biotin transporter BioY [Brucella daejeonensis]